ncbi:MAG: hypothetical protein R2765_10815 [Ferruginibacter sp.]
MIIRKESKPIIIRDYGKAEIIEINYKENPIVKKWANDLRKADNAFENSHPFQKGK